MTNLGEFESREKTASVGMPLAKDAKVFKNDVVKAIYKLLF